MRSSIVLSFLASLVAASAFAETPRPHAAIGAVVKHGGATCSARLIGCRLALAGSDCVPEGTAAKDVRLFFQHNGLTTVSDIDYVDSADGGSANGGSTALLRLAEPVPEIAQPKAKAGDKAPELSFAGGILHPVKDASAVAPRPGPATRASTDSERCSVEALRVGEPGVALQSESGKLGPEKPDGEHSIVIEEGTERLVVALNAVDESDFDLFVQYRVRPSRVDAQCAVTGAGSFASCVFDKPTAGTWHVLVASAHGASPHDTGAYQLTATAFSHPCRADRNTDRPCDDGNACTQGDRCRDGQCAGAAVVNGTSCDDNSRCTEPDRCRDGVCIGASACGDGRRLHGCEECDDGNRISGDGCEPDCRVTRPDAYTAYQIRPVKPRRAGSPARPPAESPAERRAAPREGVSLPRDWTLTIDDDHLSDASEDDPENFTVTKSKHLLFPTAIDGARPSRPDLAFIRYEMKEGRETIQETIERRPPRAREHEPRRWRVTTDAGDLELESTRVSALLVPARVGLKEPPLPRKDDGVFKCYRARVARNGSGELTPEGRFVRELQSFANDALEPCSPAKTKPKSGAWPREELGCLFDLQKPVELCSPAATHAVTGERTTNAAFAPTAPSMRTGLACFQARLATKVRTEHASQLAGVRRYDTVTPRQGNHRARRGERAVHLYPENGYPAPKRAETIKPTMICLPAELDVAGY